MKTQSYILAGFLLATLSLFAAGCVGTAKPIKTTLGISANETGMPALDYSSEKDVIYSRTSTDPDTGLVEQVDFKALASAAAFAQAEREKVQAEASKAQAEALGAAVQAMSKTAASAVSPLPQ